MLVTEPKVMAYAFVVAALGVLLLVLLAACGPTSADAKGRHAHKKHGSAARFAGVPTTTYPAPPTQVSLGDSISLGANDWERGGWVQRLAAAQEVAPGGAPALLVQKLAIGGSPSQTWASLLPTAYYRSYMENPAAARITLDTGIVDAIITPHLQCRAVGPVGAYYGAALDRACHEKWESNFYAGWDACMAALAPYAASKEVIVTSFFDPYVSFYSGVPEEQAYRKERMERMEAHARAAAEASGLAYFSMYDLLNGPAHDEDPIALGYATLADPVHPTPKAHQLIADAAARAAGAAGAGEAS